MTNFKLLIFVLATIITLYSCQGVIGAGGHNVSEKEGLTAVKERIIEKFGAETEFLELAFTSNSAQFCTFEMAYLYNNKTQMSFNKYQETVVNEPKNARKLKGEKLLKVADFDIDKILSFKGEAAQLIQAKTSEFIAFNIHEVSINATPSGKPAYIVEISAEKKDKKPTLYGERAGRGSTFFIFKFKTDKSGKLVSTKGLED